MLKFWKKTGRNIINNNNQSVEKLNVETTKQVFDPIIPLAQLEDFDENHSDNVEENKESLICRNLEDTVRNKDALNYFIEFMKIRDAFSYILCYLDIEAYKAEVMPEEEKCSILVNKLHHNHHDNIYYETPSADNNCDNFYNTTKSSSESTNLDEHLEDQFVKTALEIFKKYIALEAKFTVNCSEILRKEIMENICDTIKVLNGTCFTSVTNYLMDLMKNEYFNAYLDSDFFYKHQIDILTSDNVVLDDILYNETALFYFMEFLEQETTNKRNLLEFWLAATNLQQQLKDQKEFFDPIEAQNDAIVLYDKYFSLQAHCPLGFSDKVRLRLEQNICGENGLVINSFNIPLRIVEKYMEKNYLKSFLTCQLFYKYLSELINSVQENGYNTTSSIEQKKLNSPLSDCSSEKSFSAASNTFLVLDVTTTTKEKKKNMSIDTRELYDPDRLWRRKKIQQLSLGRVTKLGQYVADIEPDPDKKTFKLKDVVRKMISLEEEEKRKEEMAWKVAEMIVKDITSITLQDDAHY